MALSYGDEPTKIHRKIAVLGYPLVGKTSLTGCYVHGHCPDTYDITIEDVHKKIVQFKGRKYSVEIVDTAGQQEYSLHPKSCTVVDGYILVYSIDDRRSYEVVQAIHERIRDNVGDADIPTLLVGNKVDLAPSCRQVRADDARQLAMSWHAQYVETSAKDNRQVDDIFEMLLYDIEVAHGTVSRIDEHKRSCLVM